MLILFVFLVLFCVAAVRISFFGIGEPGFNGVLDICQQAVSRCNLLSLDPLDVSQAFGNLFKYVDARIDFFRGYGSCRVRGGGQEVLGVRAKRTERLRDRFACLDGEVLCRLDRVVAEVVQHEEEILGVNGWDEIQQIRARDGMEDLRRQILQIFLIRRGERRAFACYLEHLERVCKFVRIALDELVKRWRLNIADKHLDCTLELVKAELLGNVCQCLAELLPGLDDARVSIGERVLGLLGEARVVSVSISLSNSNRLGFIVIFFGRLDHTLNVGVYGLG